jgi:hypothetical protein
MSRSCEEIDADEPINAHADQADPAPMPFIVSLPRIEQFLSSVSPQQK